MSGVAEITRVGYNIVSPTVNLAQDITAGAVNVLYGIIILAFGYLLAELVAWIAFTVIKKIHLENFIHSLKISPELEKFDHAHFLATLTKWYIVALFLIPAAQVASLGEITIVLVEFGRWVPQLMLAIVIIMLGWVAVDVLISKVKQTNLDIKHIVANAAKVILLALVVVLALDQLGINLSLIHQTYLIAVGALALGTAIAVGIGFGFAIKDDAKNMLKAFKKK